MSEAEHSRVDVGVTLERSDFGHADEALGVDQQVSPDGRAARDAGVEVGAQEGAHLDPARVSERVLDPRRDVVHRPRVADLVDLHDSVVSLVVEAEPCCSLALPERDRESEALERWQQPVSVLRTAARDDLGVRIESGKRATGIEGGASRSRWPLRRRVAAEAPDDGDTTHAGTARAVRRRDSTAMTSAKPKETGKLGTVAPMPQSGGYSSATRSTHQAGPVGYSHW